MTEAKLRRVILAEPGQMHRPAAGIARSKLFRAERMIGQAAL